MSTSIPLHGLERFARDVIDDDGRASIHTLAVIVYCLRNPDASIADIAEALSGFRTATGPIRSIRRLQNIGYVTVGPPERRLANNATKKVVTLTQYGRERLGLRSPTAATASPGEPH